MNTHKALFPAAEELQQASLHATKRWLETMVIGLNLCPFAKAVYVKQQVGFVVTGSRTEEELSEELEVLLDHVASADPATMDTAILIHPLVLTDFVDYRFYLDSVAALLKRKKLRGVLQVASFHPDYEFAGEPVESVGHFTNRSPCPMLHVLRESSIERAVASFPDPASIFEKNIEQLEALGEAAVKAMFKQCS